MALFCVTHHNWKINTMISREISSQDYSLLLITYIRLNWQTILPFKFEINKFQTFLAKYKTNKKHFNKCARKCQICSLRNNCTNFVWRNDATNSQLVWRKATASSEYSVNFGLEIDFFGLYCPFYLICTAFWNVSKSPWNSIFFLWFHIDVTCATASSAEINLLVLFKQNTYFG